MTRTRYAIHEAATPISERRTFTAASMSARATSADDQYRGPAGLLPYTWESTFFADTADGRAYIVYSYGTPIGWERSDGLRVVPPVRYSNSTARHQHKLREAWGLRYGQTYAHPTREMASL